MEKFTLPLLCAIPIIMFEPKIQSKFRHDKCRFNPPFAKYIHANVYVQNFRVTAREHRDVLCPNSCHDKRFSKQTPEGCKNQPWLLSLL